MPRIDPTTLTLEEKVISLNRVQKVHKGGRTLRWSALVVVGDGAGIVGIGLGKAQEVPAAIRKGADEAKKRLLQVPLMGSTIPHQVETSYGACKVLLKPAAPGTGLIAGGSVRAVLEAAGIKDVLSKTFGSANPVNIVRAVETGLRSLRMPSQVGELRGKSAREIAPAMAAREEKVLEPA